MLSFLSQYTYVGDGCYSTPRVTVYGALGVMAGRGRAESSLGTVPLLHIRAPPARECVSYCEKVY